MSEIKASIIELIGFFFLAISAVAGFVIQDVEISVWSAIVACASFLGSICARLRDGL